MIREEHFRAEIGLINKVGVNFSFCDDVDGAGDNGNYYGVCVGWGGWGV